MGIKPTLTPVRKITKPAKVNSTPIAIRNSRFFGSRFLLEYRFEFFKTSKLEITPSEPTAWSLDGEKAEPGSDIDINIIHSAVKLML